MLNSHSSTQGSTISPYSSEQTSDRDLYIPFQDYTTSEKESKPTLASIDSGDWDNEARGTPVSTPSDDDSQEPSASWSQSASLTNCLNGDLEVARFRKWMEGESLVDMKSMREAAVLGIPMEVRLGY